MASPRAFTTVTRPPTDTDGGPLALSVGLSISFDVSDPTHLASGATLYVYPAGLKDSTPVTRARQLIMVALTAAPVGNTVAADVVDVPAGRTIGFGDVVDGFTAGGVAVVGAAAAIQPAVNAASAAGGGEVRVLGGQGDLAVALAAKSNVKLIVEPGTSLKYLSAATTSPVIASSTSGVAVAAFTGTVTENANGATLASGGSGLAKDMMCLLSKGGNVWQTFRVQSIAGNAVKFYTTFAYAFSTLWSLSTLAPVNNFTFEGKITNPDGNTAAAAIDFAGADGLTIQNSDIDGAVCVRYGLNVNIVNNIVRRDDTPGARYGIDVRESSEVLIAFNKTEMISSDFSCREYHCTDVSYYGNQWGAGARLETHDCSRRLTLHGSRGMNCDGALGTGLSFANSEYLAGFEPGHVRVSGYDFHNSYENLVFFTLGRWQDVRVSDSDLQGNTGGFDISVDASAEVNGLYLHNVRYSTLSLDAASKIYIIDDTWTAYVPVVTQSGTVTTVTVTQAEYRWQGNEVEITLLLTLSGGTGAVGGNDVEVSIPVAMDATVQANNLILGSGAIRDASASGGYTGPLQPGTTTSRVRILSGTNGADGFLGTVGFTAALALNDTIKMTGRYKVFP